tara:strand:- start:525 stop:851 length:327 start_codon:yes stop_codon:yes gene_type:complete
MDLTLIFLGLVLLIAISALAAFLYKSTSKKTFKSIDGTEFFDEIKCQNYDKKLEKLNCLYLESSRTSKNILGLSPVFLTLLRSKGFEDLKTLLEYKKDFTLLSKLLDE